MKQFLFALILILLCFTSNVLTAQNYLYRDVTNSNLPVSSVSGPGMDVESADIDNDGDKDIIIAREFAPNKILINNGNGIFTDESFRIPQFSYDSEDICVADGSGDIRKISPRIRQFERVLRSAGYLRLNKQRVGEISDERVDLSELDKQAAKNRWEEMRKKDKKLGETIPGYIYREFRQRPLLTLHVIEPGNAKEDSKRFDKMMKVEDIKPSHLVAVSLSFPRFDGAAVTVPYAMNKVALRSMGLLDDAEDSDEDED